MTAAQRRVALKSLRHAARLARTNERSTARSSEASFTNAHRSAPGSDSVHWRKGTRGSAYSR